MNEFVVLLAVGLPFALVMVITFIATKPDNLGSSEYRYSKKGREEWDERIDEFTNSKNKE